MGQRVLLCDDEIHIIRAAEIKLARAGYEVECASDGQEGWEAIQRQRRRRSGCVINPLPRTEMKRCAWRSNNRCMKTSGAVIATIATTTTAIS